MQRLLVVIYRHFGAAYLSYFQRFISEDGTDMMFRNGGN